MTEKTPAKKEKKEPTDGQRLALEYEKSPYITARLLMDIFSVIETEQDVGVHNDKIREFCVIVGEGLPKVLEKMASVVIQNTVSMK